MILERARAQGSQITSEHARAGWRASTEQMSVVLVLLVALVQGCLYLVLLPPWQHYDEPTHMEYVWLYAELGRRPETADEDIVMQREFAAAMEASDFYRGMGSPPLLADRISLGLPELHHPPIYYALASLPLRGLGYLDVTTQLYIARGVSLLLFMMTIGVVIGIMRELAPPGHALRWGVPLVAALLPPFVNQMTAVNNDVAAVLLVSFFLWGAVRLVLRGFSVVNLLWVLGAAALSPFVKSTAVLVVVFVPIVMVLAIWRQRGWQWRWVGAGAALAVLVPLLAAVAWDDAAYWYREEWDEAQAAPDRVALPEAVLGEQVFQVQVAGGSNRIMNPVAPEALEALLGKQVTVGGWVWGDDERPIFAPGLVLSPHWSTTLTVLAEPITLTTTPTLVMQTYTVPTDTGKLYAFLGGRPPVRPETPFTLYADGLFLIEGAATTEATSAEEAAGWATGPENLLRNGSAEQAGPRLRPWLEAALDRFGPRAAGFILMGMFDVGRTVPTLVGQVFPFVWRDFFVAFAWGHVRLPDVWGTLGIGLLLVSALGVVKGMVTEGREYRFVWPGLAVLALMLLAIGAVTLIWPLPYAWARLLYPSSRYLYPAVVPIALLLAGGWWLLWPPRARRYALVVLLVGLVIMNIAAVQTISGYYSG